MKKIIFSLVVAAICFSCVEKHFLIDHEYCNNVNAKFSERMEFAKNRADKLFNVFESELTAEESEALKFLYAYMPLCDLADYEGEFFLKMVQYSFKAKETFKWGSSVPEEVFRHFVLPYRVNNENLDSARIVFFKELKDRIIDMDIEEAALEVNHWCHEKVNYKSSDIRTSGPLSTVRTSHGRCGEESTFTVTALRSVGIPARQVYTPRWAHCDDNHAWVEVWINGTWKYLGACEPEPKLNMGWFTESARRAMLVHTKVFGDYSGNDEVVKKSANFTEINVISNYAETKKIFVKAVDENGSAIEKASVDFGLYNYAEFYPIATKETSTEGFTYLTTGLGDLLIWVNKDDVYAYEKISVANTDTVILQLTTKHKEIIEIDYDIYPPIEKEPLTIDDDLKEANDLRLKLEDEIRERYRTTFIDSTAINQFAIERELNFDETRKYLKMSEGNWEEIKSFIANTGPELKIHGFALLGAISEKDFRDTKANILSEHLINTMSLFEPANYKNNSTFYNYVLNPRIKNEKLVTYRKYLYNAFSELISVDRAKTIEALVAWINENISISESENYYSLPITPVGVYDLRISNMESRNVFVVAAARSIGIPARLEPAMKTPQFFDGEDWRKITFESDVLEKSETGYLSIISGGKAKDADPKYWIDFTYGKYEEGIYKTADYDDIVPLSKLPRKISADVGQYRVVTGTRRPNGSVLSRIKYFTIESNKTTNITLDYREYEKKNEIFGRLSVTSVLKKENLLSEIKNLFNREFLILGWLEPDKEPTKHALNDLKSLKENFEKWGGNLVFIVPDEKKTASFDEELKIGLPSNTEFWEDKNNQTLRFVSAEVGMQESISYPLIIVINKKGEILFKTAGYKIGIGRQLLEIIN